MSAAKDATVEVENVNHPGKTRSVDRRKYEAMKRAYLKAVPARPPGRTIAEIQERLLASLPETLFPGGRKAGWWAKTVQLDLEAKGVLRREPRSPITLYRVSGR